MIGQRLATKTTTRLVTMPAAKFTTISRPMVFSGHSEKK